MCDVSLPKYPLKNFSMYLISSNGKPEGDTPGEGIPGDHLTYFSTSILSILYIACEWRYPCGFACLHNVQCLSML